MIKNLLKQNNLTLMQFAADLNISRPTLDSYINNYQEGVLLPNTTYQKIFDFLFENPVISNNDFSKKYEYVKRYYGDSKIIPQDLAISVTSEKDNYEKNTSYSKNEVVYKRFDDSDLKYFDLLINKSNELFKLLKEYYFYSRGYENIKTISFEDIDKFTLIALAEGLISEQKTVANEEDKNKFVELADNNYQKKHDIVAKVKSVLEEKMTKIIEEEIKNIDDIDDVDYSALIDKLKQNI